MQFYFDLLQYSYNIQPIKTILFHVPFVLLLALTIFFVVALREQIKEPAGRQQFGKAIVCFILFLLSALSLSVSLATIPTYHSLNLSKSLSEKVIETYYSEKINSLEKKEEFSYEQLTLYKKNEKEFKVFKEGFLNVLPANKTITTKEVQQLFKNEHRLFLTCLENDKNLLIKSNLTFSIDSIEKFLDNSLNDCSITVSKNVIYKESRK